MSNVVMEFAPVHAWLLFFQYMESIATHIWSTALSGYTVSINIQVLLLCTVNFILDQCTNIAAFASMLPW
jgi:hypothetical protein